MPIKAGERLPEATFKIMTPDGPANATVQEVFAGKKVVLFAVPGAFTPTCSMNHLPGYLENYETILSRGIDSVAVVSVNDVWVMSEWAKHTKAEGKIVFLADGNGEFTRAVGLEADMTIAGFGPRSRRYSMIINDMVVKAVNVEEGRGVDVSGAAHILEQLSSEKAPA
jgi:glutaredoxin/glutathione-dependent peroxiredoxin